jgi:hypothetical protein
MHYLKRTLVLIVILCVAQTAYAKRLPPPDLSPLTVNGVRYSVQGGHIDELPQTAVILVAVDLNTKRHRWETTLYEIKLNPRLETDIQDVFVESMRLVDGRLELVNEAGDTIKIDAATGKVIEGGGYVYYVDDSVHRVRLASPFAWLVAGAVGMVLIVALLWHSRHRINDDSG